MVWKQIPSSRFQFPLGIKASTNSISIERKLSSKGLPPHFPYEWDVSQLWAAPQSRAVWDSPQSFSLPAHHSPSLLCSLPGPLHGGPCLCLWLLQPTACHPNLGERNTPRMGSDSCRLELCSWATVVISVSSLFITSPWSINSLEEELTHPKVELQRLLFPGPQERACLCQNRRHFTLSCVASKAYLCFSPSISEEARVCFGHSQGKSLMTQWSPYHIVLQLLSWLCRHTECCLIISHRGSEVNYVIGIF